jgi:hypothetical protein
MAECKVKAVSNVVATLELNGEELDFLYRYMFRTEVPDGLSHTLGDHLFLVIHGAHTRATEMKNSA